MLMTTPPSICPFAGAGIDGLADVVRGDERFDLPGFGIQNAQLRRVAVGHVRDGVWLVCTEGIGLGVIFAVEFPAYEIVHGLPSSAAVNRSHARRQASPVIIVWREPDVSPESGAIQVFERS